MNILISGGHLTPALAFIDYALKHHAPQEITFIGRVYSQEKLKQKSQEQTEVSSRGVTFDTINAPRWYFSSMLEIPLIGWRFFTSLFSAVGLVRKYKPDVFVSFGGYMAVPLAIAAAILRVPIITHEQTQTAGFANTLIARLATKVAVAYPEAVALFPEHKTVVTGNLLRPALLERPKHPPEWITIQPTAPLLYITGGNQGSEILNTVVMQALPQLTRNWFVIHQCGNQTAVRNYRQELESARGKLSARGQRNFVVKEWVSDQDLSWIYHHAECVIARAGANTVHELATLAIPSVLVPLPFAHHDEQTISAKALADEGAALLLPQKELNPQSLLEHVDKVSKFNRSMRAKLKALKMETNGNARLYALVIAVGSTHTA